MLDTRWWARRRTCTIVVQLRDGGSIQGVLGEVSKHVMTLRAAVLIGEDGDTPIAGEAVIPAENIAWWQDLGAAPNGPTTTLERRLEVAK